MIRSLSVTLNTPHQSPTAGASTPRVVRPHRFFVQLNPLCRDQHFPFTGHFVANPATNFTKKTRGAFGRNAKKHENTTVLNKQTSTICAFQCWLNGHLASFQKRSWHLKKKKTSTPLWSADPFCVLTYKNDIRLHGVMSIFSRLTSDKHVPFWNVGGHGTVQFWGPRKGRDAWSTPRFMTRHSSIPSVADFCTCSPPTPSHEGCNAKQQKSAYIRFAAERSRCKLRVCHAGLCHDRRRRPPE